MGGRAAGNRRELPCGEPHRCGGCISCGSALSECGSEACHGKHLQGASAAQAAGQSGASAAGDVFTTYRRSVLRSGMTNSAISTPCVPAAVWQKPQGIPVRIVENRKCNICEIPGTLKTASLFCFRHCSIMKKRARQSRCRTPGTGQNEQEGSCEISSCHRHRRILRAPYSGPCGERLHDAGGDLPLLITFRCGKRA